MEEDWDLAIQRLRGHLDDCINKLPIKNKEDWDVIKVIITLCNQRVSVKEYNQRLKYLKTPETKKQRPYLLPILVFGEGLLLAYQKRVRKIQ